MKTSEAWDMVEGNSWLKREIKKNVKKKKNLNDKCCWSAKQELDSDWEKPGEWRVQMKCPSNIFSDSHEIIKTSYIVEHHG